MTDSSSRTYQAKELDFDPHQGHFIYGCPNCGQDYAMISLGGICVECGITLEISEVEVTWDDE